MIFQESDFQLEIEICASCLSGKVGQWKHPQEIKGLYGSVIICRNLVMVRWHKRKSKLGLLLGAGGLLGQEDGLDVGEDAALGDGDAGQQLVQLLVISDGELEMPGDDPGLLVVPGGVSGQLKDLGGEVLHDGGHVDRRAGAHALGVVALPKEPVDPAHGELEPRPAGPGLRLALHLAALATSGHLWFGLLKKVNQAYKLG